MFRNPSAASWAYISSPTNPAVESFHRSLPDYSVTPLVSLPDLAQELGLKHVLLKDESSRLGLPAFKILGASWATFRSVALKCGLPLTVTLEEMAIAAREQNVRLVACTEGNWGRAVARMAKLLQSKSFIFVPAYMDQATQEKIRAEGADVIVVDGNYDFSIEKARDMADKENGLLVMDTSWDGYEQIPQWVVEGYSTMLIETDKQLKEKGIHDATHAIASMGVGSWAQAVALHYKAKTPPATVVTVEPNSAACLKASLEAGTNSRITTGHTIMNGMNCGMVSKIAWDVLKHAVDASVTVADFDVHLDLQYLHQQGIQNGPCGAAPLSALKRLCQEKKHELLLSEESVVVLFSTEGMRDYTVPNSA